MNINNFKISTKLTLGFGLMAVLLFLISATSLWKAKNLHDDFESVMHQQYPKVVKIEEIKDLLNTNEVSISHMLHYKESASHEDLIEKVLATRAKIAEALQFLQTQEMDAEEQAILEPESVTIPPAPSTAPINIPRCLPTAPPIDANDAQSQ